MAWECIRGHGSFWRLPPLPLEVVSLEVGPLNPARSLGSAINSPVGSGAKSQPPTILLHFEDLETLLMTSKMCIVLYTWFVFPCPFLPQQSSQNFCIFRVAKNYRTPFGTLTLLVPGGICPLPSYPPLLFLVLIRYQWHWHRHSKECVSRMKVIFIK